MANEAYIDLDRLTLYDTQLKTYDSTVLQMDGTANAGTSKRAARADHVHPTDTSRAPLASPALTGTPTAPTAATTTNNTQIATTAFVRSAISSYGGETNQNAFSNVKVGSTTIAADSKTDTLELVAGSNVTLTPDATNDKVTIAATNTTYSDFTGATSSAAGTHGLVPAPPKSSSTEVLTNGAEWVSVREILGLNLSEDSQSSGFLKFDTTEEIVSTATLAAADIPNLAASKITSGTLGVARGGTGASTLGAGVVYHSASGTGALSIATAANLVSAIGTTAVNRATADAAGNNIADTYAKKTDVTGVYKYVGSVATASALPASPSTGDVYNIEAESTYGPAGTNVAWTGSAWDALGGIFSITTATNAQIEALFA